MLVITIIKRVVIETVFLVFKIFLIFFYGTKSVIMLIYYSFKIFVKKLILDFKNYVYLFHKIKKSFNKFSKTVLLKFTLVKKIQFSS